MLLLNLVLLVLGMALGDMSHIQPEYKELQCDDIVGKAKFRKSSEFRPFLFTSPRYPNAYPKNAKCQVTFKVPKGKKVYFHFNEVDIFTQDPSNCRGDYLRINDGRSRDDFCGQFNDTSHILGPYNKVTSVKVIFKSNKDRKKGKGVSLGIWSKQLTTSLGNFSCGLSDISSRSVQLFDDRIIGGQNTTIFDHPWSVNILGYFKNPAQVSVYNGGTLISPQWVMTAVGPPPGLNGTWTDLEMNNVWVILNVTAFGQDPSTLIRLDAIDIKTMENSGFPFFDLALVKMNQSVASFMPACLPGPDFKYIPGKNYRSIGYGLDVDLAQLDQPYFNPRLRQVDLELHSKEFCAQAVQNIVPYGVLMTEDQLSLLDPYPKDFIVCGGENGTTTCVFDQGSSLSDDIYGYSVSVGVTSFWSTNCTGQTFFAKVQTAVGWIYETVNELN